MKLQLGNKGLNVYVLRHLCPITFLNPSVVQIRNPYKSLKWKYSELHLSFSWASQTVMECPAGCTTAEPRAAIKETTCIMW